MGKTTKAEESLGHHPLKDTTRAQDLAEGGFSVHSFIVGRSDAGLLASEYFLVHFLRD